MAEQLPPLEIVEADTLKSPAQVGAKAFRLGQLARQGYRVPSFFCVAAASHQQFVALPTAETPAYTACMQAQLAACAARILPGVTRFAVRSSALVEDGRAASFAGQFETLLDVDAEGLGQAVATCWQAAAAGRALAYTKQTGVAQGFPYMGVIIQQMVAANVSGVAFSANPQGILNEAVIVCGAGTGDKVVTDQIATTTYYHNLHDRQFYYEQQRGAALLPPHVTQLLLEALKTLGAKAPVDVEYAVKDGEVWFLQQRPITTLGGRTPTVLDNSNIVESYGGLCLPLTISFAKYVYTQVFTGLARRCLPKKLLPQYAQLLGEMVNSANGRMYYQISNWYTILKFLPMQKKIIPLWQRMLGVQAKQYDAESNPVSVWSKIVIHGKILAAAVGIPRKMTALEKEFDAARALFKREFHAGAAPESLGSLFDQLAEIVLRNWDITLLNDMYAFVFTGLQERQFKKAGAPPNSRYLTGNKDMESLKPVQDAWALAQKLRKHDSLRAELTSLKTAAEAQSYLAAGSAFAEEVNRYIDAYGDRSFEELKLETQTFRSDPLAFIQLLLAYAGGAITQPVGVHPPEEENPPLPQLGFWQRRLVRWTGKKARLGIANREASRLNRGRIFGMVRAIFTEVGATLYGAGLLEQPQDVLYLALDELLTYMRCEEDGRRFCALVRQRKAEYEGFATLPGYSRLVFAGPVFSKSPRLAQQGGSAVGGFPLRGTPCAQGEVEGEALVVTTPISADAARGKILVTHTTDPGWVFLLAVAKGVIAEKGSLLSHTAIITREFGLPSVVGVENATSIIKTGDKIHLNGGIGSIEKCDD